MWDLYHGRGHYTQRWGAPDQAVDNLRHAIVVDQDWLLFTDSRNQKFDPNSSSCGLGFRDDCYIYSHHRTKAEWIRIHVDVCTDGCTGCAHDMPKHFA